MTSWAGGIIKAPIVFGRGHLDCGPVAFPNRETEGMVDGLGIVADGATVNAEVDVASSESWIAFQNGR